MAGNKLFSFSPRAASLMPAAAVALALLALQPQAWAFNFEDVASQAKTLAASPYKKPKGELPKALQDLGYDQYRDIRFNPDKALWRDAKLPFEVAFFHPGRIFDTPVRINEVVGKAVRPIAFDPKSFNYGANKINPKDMNGLDFAGFRVHYPVNTPKYKDEVLVFLGASYFRAVGKDQRYGLSTRGLAIDTALNSGEEFPLFTDFWIERPEAGAKELVIYALLNSRRMTGAYRFLLRPGVDTAVDVKSRLFARENITKVGLAPLTSMFFSGENQRSPAEDFRPEVHDSDGLSVESGTGEWIWRPLLNPKKLLVTSYALSNPGGFGMMQRDRDFTSYQDLESRFELRPSAWVEPKGKWGSGRVELVQIPTPDETNDNIVTYWVPDAPPKPGVPFDFEYRLLWQKDKERKPPLSWVTQTRRGHGYLRKPDDSIALLVDFEGPALAKLPADAKPEAVVSVDGNGKLLETHTIRNEATGGWRIALRMTRNDTSKPVELRGFLRNNNLTLSETWSYILSPD
ncbi:glucan biosynthesis protein G [Noviherbaspirillum suwonense]|jgi:glucans biosynthesis protein|uniref:Glucans biosynthesis protein G n=1 Tax=Noviherbaspirillum suwonense TaxID=1224511 RepID=A0ABY1PVN2_9BURK|nr:glucans biosynthesis protein [Noviherbaspirillum suwonense]